MIARIWHGYTTPENADAYQDVLLGTVMPEIAGRGMDGYLGFHSLRREGTTGPDGGAETEFITVMWFESAAQIEQFVGRDSTVSHVPEVARKVLKRWDERSAHYAVQSAPAWARPG
ncbi:MAG: antibiotic biosynthesis monooxygenase [Planctomycetota bacterium]